MKKTTILIVLLVIIVGGAAYFFLMSKGEDNDKEAVLYSYVPGDYFVTNVKDSSKLFKTTVVIMLDTDELEEELSSKEYIIRDTIIFCLRELTEEDILSEGIQDKLRTDLTEKLNAVLEIDNIVNVYFNDFVMQ